MIGQLRVWWAKRQHDKRCNPGGAWSVNLETRITKCHYCDFWYSIPGAASPDAEG